MPRNVRAWLGLVLATIVVAAAACGGSDGGSSAPPAGSAPPGTAKTGGSSIVIHPIDAASLDPATTNNAPSQGSTILNAIYDVLYTVDRDGNVVPNIATSFSSEDGLTWTMKLRDDVTFTDGTTLDAEAVRAHWERSKANPRALAWAYLQDLVSMTAVDATTFQVVLGSVNRQFHQLAPWSSLVWIPSPTAIAAAGDKAWDKPVGAGPFTLESRTPNAETVLVKNPNYWQKGLPKLDKLTLRAVPDPQQAYDTVTTGGADAYINVPDQYAAQARDAGMATLTVPQVGGTAWLFGVKRAPFNDPKAREAVYYAIDPEAQNMTVAEGKANLATTLLPESSPLYDGANPFPAPDKDRAQKLFNELAQAGTPLSFTITTTEGDAKTRAEALQAQFTAFENVKVEVQVLPGPSYGGTLFGGDYDLALYGMGGTDPEPAFAAMRSNHPLPIIAMNSPEVDAAIKIGRESTDVTVRKGAYNDLAKAMNGLYRLRWVARNNGWAMLSQKATGFQQYGQNSVLVQNYGLTG